MSDTISVRVWLTTININGSFLDEIGRIAEPDYIPTTGQLTLEFLE